MPQIIIRKNLSSDLYPYHKYTTLLNTGTLQKKHQIVPGLLHSQLQRLNVKIMNKELELLQAALRERAEYYFNLKKDHSGLFLNKQFRVQYEPKQWAVISSIEVKVGTFQELINPVANIEDFDKINTTTLFNKITINKVVNVYLYLNYKNGCITLTDLMTLNSNLSKDILPEKP